MIVVIYTRRFTKRCRHMTHTTQHRKLNDDFWLRLDNAAKIYPAIKDHELTSVFRVAAVLKHPVRILPFMEAIQAIENRFPYYKVRLKAGFFWYYLEHSDQPISVEHDTGTPCRSFSSKELMFRVLVKKNRISVEFSHILTDGTGALEFLKILLATYFKKCSILFTPDICSSLPEQMAKEEYEDSYNRYFKKIKAPYVSISNAFHIPFSLKKVPRFDVLIATLPSASILNKAKEHHVSLTGYLTSVYLYALQKVYLEQSVLMKKIARKIIRVEVPINLRKLYPSKTMRNFSLYVLPGIDMRLGTYSFDEIVKIVYHQMQLETDKKLINKMISRNVSGERNTFVRSLPLFIKSFFLSRLYTVGTKQYSGVVTNMGKINLGYQENELIDQMIFIAPPPNKILKVNCAVAGFGDKLILSFGNISTSRVLEKHFLTFLTHQDIPVKISRHEIL